MKLFRSLLIALAVAGSLLPAHASQAAPPVGTLAYVRRGQEIRLVGADGQGDRLVWTHPNPEVAEAFGVTSLAWRPDGGALAFTSDHEQARSLYQSDLYTVGLDGTGLRRLTNAPAHAELARLPQGAVKVTVRRQLSLESGAILGPLVVYVVGADKPQTVTIGANDAQTLTFPRVAVLGDVAQPIVAIDGERRWMIPGVRVFAGRTIEAPALEVVGRGIANFGAYGAAWHSDGRRLAYVLGSCVGLYQVSADPQPGAGLGVPLADTEEEGACAFACGPAGAHADERLFVRSRGEPGLYRADAAGRPARLLASEGQFDAFRAVCWLPDGAGCVYARFEDFTDETNLHRYDFATRQHTRLTSLDGEHVLSFDVSPDGQWVVYERNKEAYVSGTEGAPRPELWLVPTAGGPARRLLVDGRAPVWAPAAQTG